MGRTMHHFAASVLMLAVPSKCNGEDLAVCPLTAQVHRWILHSQFAAQITVYPFHGGFFVCHRPLGDQIVDVVSPVLDSGIAYTCARLADDLHHSAMERLTGIGWRGAPLDVVHLCTLIDDDERTLELS